MQKNIDTIPIGWRITQKAKDDFVDFCDIRGSSYEDEASGAIYLWPYIPSNIRELAKLSSKGVGKDKQFWDIFLRKAEQAFGNHHFLKETKSKNKRLDKLDVA